MAILGTLGVIAAIYLRFASLNDAAKSYNERAKRINDIINKTK